MPRPRLDVSGSRSDILLGNARSRASRVGGLARIRVARLCAEPRSPSFVYLARHFSRCRFDQVAERGRDHVVAFTGGVLVAQRSPRARRDPCGASARGCSLRRGGQRVTGVAEVVEAQTFDADSSRRLLSTGPTSSSGAGALPFAPTKTSASSRCSTYSSRWAASSGTAPRDREGAAAGFALGRPELSGSVITLNERTADSDRARGEVDAIRVRPRAHRSGARRTRP